MVKFKVFYAIKDVFSKLNPISSFDLDEIDVEISKPPSSVDLLKKAIKKYPVFDKIILIAIYHLINTQNLNKEYLTVLTKDMRLICDLVEGNENSVEIPEILKNEPSSNMLLTCHNHFNKSIIPSSKDFKNIVKPKIRFTLIVSETCIGILINELLDDFYDFDDDERLEFVNNWKSFLDYILFCMANDNPNDVIKFYMSDNLDDDYFQSIFDEYVGENILKFVDEFNLRFKKYNMYYVYISI